MNNEPVRIIDISHRGSSWQLHDHGNTIWTVHPWYSTTERYGTVHRATGGTTRGWITNRDRYSGTPTRHATFRQAVAHLVGHPAT